MTLAHAKLQLKLGIAGVTICIVLGMPIFMIVPGWHAVYALVIMMGGIVAGLISIFSSLNVIARPNRSLSDRANNLCCSECGKKLEYHNGNYGIICRLSPRAAYDKLHTRPIKQRTEITSIISDYK